MPTSTGWSSRRSTRCARPAPPSSTCAIPKWLLDAKGEFYNAIRYPEFTAQIADYLATTGPKYPKTIEQLIERAQQVNAPRPDGAGPNPGRWGLMKREAGSGTLDDYRYTSVRDHGLPLVRAVVEGLLAAQKLDAIVYPTASRRPAAHRRAARGAGRRRRLAGQHRQPQRVSRI